MRSLRLLQFFSLSALIMLALSGCNLYGGIDSPSGDAQLASAAQDAFDQGNFSQAFQYYQRLSSAYADIANSQEAYVIYDQNGATMQAFASGFGNGKNISMGTAFTQMTNTMIQTAQSGNTTSPGSTARSNIYTGFMDFKNITDSTNLAAIVQFLGAVGFASEILAEMATLQGSSTLTTSVISANTLVPCHGGGTTGLESVSASTVASGPTLDLFNSALIDIQSAINTLSASGSLASSFTNAFSTLAADGITLSAGCGTTNLYDTALSDIGVGTTQ